MVEKLHHAKTSERQSCCPTHAPRTAIRRTPIKSSPPKVNPKLPLERSKPRLPIKPARKKIKEKSTNEIPALLHKAVEVFNAAIRRRDTDAFDGVHCISCGNLFLYQVSIQAGHYMPSTYSVLRFNELNCNAECESCNVHDPNHLVGYRKNLIRKIGITKVEWLESHTIAKDFKWDREFLQNIIDTYKTKYL